MITDSRILTEVFTILMEILSQYIPELSREQASRKKLKFFLTFELKMKRLYRVSHLKYNNILN